MGLTVAVIDEAGTYFPLSRFGVLSGIEYTTGWGNGEPGGFQSGQFVFTPQNRMDFPQWLRKGRECHFLDGPHLLGVGKLAEGEPATSGAWHVNGLSSEANDYGCFAPTETAYTTTSVPQLAVETAIADGLPWHPDSAALLSVDPFSASEETADLNTIRELLDAVAQAEGKRWGVFADSVLTLAEDPTEPIWRIRGQDPLLPVAADDEVTHVASRYVSAVDGTPPAPSAFGLVRVGDDGAVTESGRRQEEMYPLVDLGLMTEERAEELALAYLATKRARTGFTSGFTVTEDQVFSMGGIRARLSLVKAGDMVRAHGVLDIHGHLGLGGLVDFVIGETRYVHDDRQLHIQPVGMAPRTAVDLWALAGGTPRKFSEAS